MRIACVASVSVKQRAKNGVFGVLLPNRTETLATQANMRIRYHFIANLHITETRFTRFLTKYDKIINDIIG